MYKYIFVDCFDTIIKRRVSSNKIKYLWAEKMSEYYKLAPVAFFRMFLGVEKFLVKKFTDSDENGEWNFDELCDELYRIINIYKILDEKVLKEEFINICKQSYYEVEKENQYVNNNVINILKRYKRNGCKILLVSDFYCGKNFISKCLSNFKLLDLIDDVFVSCDLKMSKRTGTIYNYLLCNLDIQSGDVLMIGDNKFSDYQKARENSIDAIRVFSHYKKDNLNKLMQTNKEKQNVIKKFGSIFSADNGYSNYAFSLYYFVVELYYQIKCKKTKNIFFLSREGEFLKKIFDYYLTYIGDKSIKTHYLLMSRNSILLAGLNDLSKETFDCVIREKSSISVKEFLTTLQVDNKTMSKICADLNCNIDEHIHNFTKTEVFRKIINNINFINFYNQVREEQNQAFNTYIHSFDVDFEKDGISIVDVGWKGTMQDLIFKFFNGKIKISGYYLGLNKSINIQKNNIKTGLLYSNFPMYPSYCDKLFGLRIINFEQILKASHNRVKGYKLKNNKIEIEYDDEHDESKFYFSEIKPLQDKIYSKFIYLCSVEYENLKQLKYNCAKLHFRMIYGTSLKDFKWLNTTLASHYDSFAAIGVQSKDKSNFLRYIRFKLSNLKYLLKIKIKG